MSGSGTGAAPVASSGSTQDNDEIMTKEHKLLLQNHRDTIVENMIADELMSRLQSTKVLSTREVARIKEKGSDDGMNESLLDIIRRKPNRAYLELVRSLRETDQNHIANLLDKSTVPQKTIQSAAKRTPGAHAVRTPSGLSGRTPSRSNIANAHDDDADGEDGEDDETAPARPTTSRKRRARTMGVYLEPSQIDFDEDEEEEILPSVSSRSYKKLKKHLSREELLTSKINEEILETTLIELKNLKDVARAGVSVHSTQARKGIMETLKDLQRLKREILGLDQGSTVFIILCPSLESADDLWRLCQDGTLQRWFQTAYITDSLKRKLRIRSVSLTVKIPEAEYVQCRHELGACSNQLPCVVNDVIDSDDAVISSANDIARTPSRVDVADIHNPYLHSQTTPHISARKIKQHQSLIVLDESEALCSSPRKRPLEDSPLNTTSNTMESRSTSLSSSGISSSSLFSSDEENSDPTFDGIDSPPDSLDDTAAAAQRKKDWRGQHLS